MNARLLLGAIAAAAYLVSCWWLMRNAAEAPWSIAVIFGPWLLPLLGVALRRRHWWLGLAALAGAAALVMVVAAGGLGDVRRLYLLQYVGVHGGAAVAFAASLRAGATPMITAMARRVHTLPPGAEAYTRATTWMWTGYFAGATAASLAVYALLPWSAWALLANVITPAVVATLFVGEYLLRYRLHPEFERVTLDDMVRVARGLPPAPSPAAVQGAR